MQEEPRMSEEAEFSKQTATAKGLLFYEGGGSKHKSHTYMKQTFVLCNISLGHSFKFNTVER